MPGKHDIAQNLAAALLSGTWSRWPLLRRGALATSPRQRWLGRLIKELLVVFPQRPAHRSWETLTAFIETNAHFEEAWPRFASGQLRHLFWVTPAMCPAAGPPLTWQVPALPTPAALASWLGLQPAQLNWFADCHGHEAAVRAGSLRHYTYRWLAKRSGWRLLEAPKARLKALQRRLLHELLEHIPAHDAVHGYRPGRSIATFAAPHCGCPIVLRFDLRHFFPSVRSSRVHAVFATAGYPREVARLLTGLCTNSVPDDVWLAAGQAQSESVSWRDRKRYRASHLPQGAPTSPALANLCAYRLDCRLQGLAQAVGGRYTRYADDLAFSGDRDLERSARRFQVEV